MPFSDQTSASSSHLLAEQAHEVKRNRSPNVRFGKKKQKMKISIRRREYHPKPGFSFFYAHLHHIPTPYNNSLLPLEESDSQFQPQDRRGETLVSRANISAIVIITTNSRCHLSRPAKNEPALRESSMKYYSIIKLCQSSVRDVAAAMKLLRQSVLAPLGRKENSGFLRGDQ